MIPTPRPQIVWITGDDEPAAEPNRGRRHSAVDDVARVEPVPATECPSESGRRVIERDDTQREAAKQQVQGCIGWVALKHLGEDRCRDVHGQLALRRQDRNEVGRRMSPSGDAFHQRDDRLAVQDHRRHASAREIVLLRQCACGESPIQNRFKVGERHLVDRTMKRHELGGQRSHVSMLKLPSDHIGHERADVALGVLAHVLEDVIWKADGDLRHTKMLPR